MPNSPQAAKRMRQNEKARVRNKALRTAMKTQIKKVRAALESGDATTAEQELAAAMKRIDKAAQRGVIHPNNAARRKSALSRGINALKSKGASAPA